MKHFSRLLLAALMLLPTIARAVEQQKGVILKITDSGTGGNVIPQPMGDDPKRVVAELNAQRVTEVRVQVNNGTPMSEVTAAGAKATDLLAEMGFTGKVILDNKQWHLNKPESQADWVSAMHETYQKMSPRGKAIVGGFSFGETTAGEESWKDYSTGIAAAVRSLERAFRSAKEPKGLEGKKFYVGGASLGGSFRHLKPDEHRMIEKAIAGVGGTLIYAYKSFHSRKGLPESKPEDLASKASAKKFLLEEAGLANLAKVAGQTPVQYRGNAGDYITREPEVREALIEIFKEHPNFLHVGAGKVIEKDASEREKGCLFDESSAPEAKEWRKLNDFFDAIRK